MEKISGFSILRNGVKFEYPFLQSWRSILPLVDELVIGIGEGEDQTWQIAETFRDLEGNGKVILFSTQWPLNDPEKKKSGQILAEQTNLALDRCRFDWCFYLQADEVLHEDDFSKIRQSLKEANDKNADAIVFEYRHFYGAYNVIQRTRSSYRREIRLFRKSVGARSVGDAQSFRKPNHEGIVNEKLKAVLSEARIFHYGWVKSAAAMKSKTTFMDQLYHGEASGAEPYTKENYRFKRYWGLETYRESHPLVMRERIQQLGWVWDLKTSAFHFSVKDIQKIILDSYERLTGHRPFEFKNYHLV